MISACLITKNEQNNLHRCLSSLKGVVDEIIVVDTGSEDDTLRIAVEFNCNIFHFDWSDDFAKARNFSISKAANKFILIIDADEVLQTINLRSYLSQYEDFEGGFFVNIFSTSKNSEGIENKFNSRQIRIFSNFKNIYFKGKVHEQVIDSILNQGMLLKESSVNISHYGYDCDAKALRNKNIRNLKLIEQELKLNPKNYYYKIHKSKTLYALGELQKSKDLLLNMLSDGLSDNLLIYQINNILGGIFIKENNLKEAVKCFKESSIANPNQIYSFYKLADIFYSKKKYIEAAAILEIIIKNISSDNLSDDFIINPNEIIFKIAKLYIISNKYQSALEILNNENLYNKNDVNILILKANAYFKINNYTKAMEIINFAAQLKPESTFIQSIQKKISFIINKIKPFISLCMIVKNEENYLKECLEIAKNFCDEIIIVDTGSSDKTKEIAAEFTDKIYDYQWTYDFSEARNKSLEYATGEWILYLDADERILLFDKNKLINYLKYLPEDIGGVNCTILNDFKSSDGKIEVQRGFYPRIFRNYEKNKIYFQGKVHEQISESLIKLNKSVCDSDICIHHIGYNADKNILDEKIYRNYILLKENLLSNPEDFYSKFQLAQTLTKMKKLEEAEQHFEELTLNNKMPDKLLASTFNILGQIKGINKNYSAALSYAELSLEISEMQNIAYLIKAEALNKLGKKQEAVSTLEKLLEVKKSFPVIPAISFDVDISEQKLINSIKIIQQSTNIINEN